MQTTVTLLSGPAGAGKTRRLLDRYRSVLANCPPGGTLWLAPTSRAAADIQHRLLSGDLRACFSPGISTFARFTTALLAKSAQLMRPLTTLMKRQLIGQLLEDQRRAGRLEHFGPIASTAGLLDLVCDFIRQMKRLEIWPEQFEQSCRERGVGQKDRELLAIYQAYQQRLVDHNLYDAEGRSWSARDLLRQQPMRYELVVADGFSDFTQTEHDMLQTLAEHAAETWISLPLEESGAGREDLFQKPLRTRDELRRRHPGLREETLARAETPAWPALAHLERTIFSNPRGMKSAPDTARLEIMACGREINEIETIGRRIKRLLIDGHAKPGDIAVVFRRVQPLADEVREVFQRLEFPYYIESAQPLGCSPPVAMLVRLLELDADDWPMHKLLAVLGNNYFSPAWTEWNDLAAGPVERTIRALQIPRGRDRLLERLGVGWAERSESHHESSGVSQQWWDSLHSAHPTNAAASPVYHLLRGLADALDKLPKLDTLAAHARAWNELAEQVGIFGAMRGDAERSAWEQLREALDEGQRLAEWLGQDAPRLDRAQTREALRDILGSHALRLPSEESGRVRVLSAASVRHLKVPYLFLAGLSERSFPAADSDDGVYSQAERQRLIEAGLPLPSRGERQSEEMLLFYEAINAATQRLWLSYPAVDQKGEPLAASPYVKEVLQACGETSIVQSGKIDLSPVADAAEVCSQDAFRIRAAADARDGKPELLAGLASNDSRGGESLLRGLEFSLARQDRERFGPSEGMLGKAAVTALAAEFSGDRVYSTTELESFAYCPYRYFLEKLLGVQPLDEIELEVDYAGRGRMAHNLLAVLHRRVNEARGGPESPAALTPEEFERILAESAAEALAGAGGNREVDALREIDRRKVMEWIGTYRERHADYDKQLKDCDSPPRPELFEVSFGQALREGQGAASTAEPLEFTRGGETVRLSGRIDRLDLGQAGGHTIFNIVDYKTGSGTKFSVEAFRRGTALQLPVYTMAAAELILNHRDALPWRGGYWYISGDGFKPRQALQMYQLSAGSLEPTETWEAVRDLVADTVIGLVKAMRRGEFPVWSDDEDCTGRCPFKTVCRINQVRSLGKTWRP